jgi:hypothetical protein
MITKEKKKEREASPPTDDREAVVTILKSDEEWVEYYGDEIAEVITLPGGMVQAIDMAGERHDPIDGEIAFVSGTSWSVWSKKRGEVTRYDDENHIQKIPNGTVVLPDNTPRNIGNSIRRAKRTTLLDN